MGGDSFNAKQSFEAILRSLSGLMQDICIYPENHPEIQKILKLFLDNLEMYFKEENVFSFKIIEEEIVFNNKPCMDLSETLSVMIKKLFQKKISILNFYKGISECELLNFCRVMNNKDLIPSTETSWSEILKNNLIYNISCEHLVIRSPKGGNHKQYEISQDDLASLSKDTFRVTVDQLKELDEGLKLGKTIDYTHIVSVISQLTPQILKHYDEILFLGSIKEHDENTFEHVLNVAVLSCLLGAAIFLPENILDGLCVAGFLHDTGKKKISLDILMKAGKLTDEERSIIETHSQEGGKMLLFDETIGDVAALVAFEHHLNYDGTGYPVLKRKRDPSLVSRIVTIADFYDALRGTRVYSGEMSPETVYKIMLDEKGKKFDPLLLDIFFETIGVYPAGTQLVLDTKEIAVVTKQNSEDILRPYVRILSDKYGDVSRKNIQVSLLLKNSGLFERSIIKVIPPVDAKKDIYLN